MKLINLVTNQSVLAFRIIKSYTNNPSIAGVTVQQISLTKTYSTEISKQVIINDTGGRKIIHDNFALEPIGWKLTGYIKPHDYEMSFYFQPSLKSQLKKLEEARDTGDVVDFKDKYGQTYKVGIEKMEIEENAESQNAIPISFDLIDVTQQEASSATVTKAESSATPNPESKDGSGKSLGTNSGKEKSIAVSIGSSIFE